LAVRKIRVVIIEDNSLLRKGIRAMLKEVPRITVVAAAGDSGKALTKIRDLKPDVLLLDLRLPGENTWDLVNSLRKKFPQIKVIMMDLVPNPRDILEFVEAGVSGFILKDAPKTDFIEAVKSVAAGNKVLPQNMTGSLFSQIVDYGVKEVEASRLVESVSMTTSEREVVGLIADGLTDKEIERKLHLSNHVVKSHVHNILKKMALSTRVQIAIYAREAPGSPDSNEKIAPALGVHDNFN
jgi:DNA-binding NarL/FixJ family response regulator